MIAATARTGTMQAIVSELQPADADWVRALIGEALPSGGGNGPAPEVVPHVTFQVASAFDAEGVGASLAAVADESGPVAVRTEGLSIFTGERPMLSVALVRDRALTRLHQRLWDALAPNRREVRDAFSPASWMPHLTLAYGLTDAARLADAVRRLAPADLRRELLLDNLTLLEAPAPPASEVRRYPLA